MDPARTAYVSCAGCRARPPVSIDTIYPDGGVWRVRCPACDHLNTWGINELARELFREKKVLTVDEHVERFALELEDGRPLYRVVYA